MEEGNERSEPRVAPEKLKEIWQRVFEGTVPVKLRIESVDYPLCFNIRRCVSLGTFAYAHLTGYIGDKCDQLWFSHGGSDKPVKWYLPIGVVYDTLCPLEEDNNRKYLLFMFIRMTCRS